MLRSATIILLAATLFAAFCFLGSWQLQRRAWKLDLIDSVEQQLQQAPVAAPAPAAWPGITPASAYQPVIISGQFLHEQESLVQAMTSYGSGYWVLTPLLTADGYYVLVNRGFVDQQRVAPESRPQGQIPGQVTITGLLRLSEPDGRFLQSNNPVARRWYSRDVEAIGRSLALPAERLAPYFIDADHSPNAGGWPVGGLTVVRFRNNHLGYALTWYALALMTAVGALLVFRYRRATG